MNKMKLGSQGLEVPVLGLGCMGMTGFEDAHMYGAADEKEAIATIHRPLSVNEALHLSALEEEDLIGILLKIDRECERIDMHTQEICCDCIQDKIPSNTFMKS